LNANLTTLQSSLEYAAKTVGFPDTNFEDKGEFIMVEGGGKVVLAERFNFLKCLVQSLLSAIEYGNFSEDEKNVIKLHMENVIRFL